MRPVGSTSSRAFLALLIATLLGGCAGSVSDSASSSRPQATTRSAAGKPGSGARSTGATQPSFALTGLEVPAANAGNGLDSSVRLRLPRAWRVEVWARVPDGRLEAWTPEGQLLVSEPDDGRVMELVPRHDRAAPPLQRVLVSGLDEPQGLAFADLGGGEVLYVAETNEVDRYTWRDGRLGDRHVVVSNLPDTAPAGSDNHTLKNIVVGAGGRIFLDIGSGSNASPPAPSDPPRASVVSYTANGKQMRVLATGVRNGDGLSFAPDGTLWTAVNERDEIAYPFHRSYTGQGDAYGAVIQAYVNDHPPDELARLTPGRDLGWPYCDPEPDASRGSPGSALRYAQLPFTDDAQTNPRGAALDCAKLMPLDRGLPAHSAPLGFHFLEGSRLPSPWSAGAIVAVHGSWDRDPARPPAVLWLPWDSATETLGAPITLVGGFQEGDGTRWGRPVDAVAGPDGALYVSDDTAGAVYRIVP